MTLQQLGCDAESEDDLLGQIRSEVKKLGTQQAITRELLHLERRDTTDYVIKRPQVLPSTRDYLSDKHRLGGREKGGRELGDEGIIIVKDCVPAHSICTLNSCSDMLVASFSGPHPAFATCSTGNLK